MKLICLIFFATFGLISADVYMHNPRGSVNRRDQNNGGQNRLFDSQDNNNGGYNWGPSMYFYEGSELTIEWTNQHSCGNTNAECQIVLQYMCGGTKDETTIIRDGTTDTRIVDNKDQYNQKDDAGEFLYGMHESYAYYQECKQRERNKGLFIANNNLGDSATRTRQNNGGGQNGFECPEERDYYPYWAPSPWKDIAILTDESSDICGSDYEGQSQNVVSKYHCLDGDGNPLPPISEKTCEAQKGGVWTEVKSWDLDKPECLDAPWSRDNHLGNGFTGHNLHYNWTIPSSGDLPCLDGEKDSCNCVLRIRYNISTKDTDNWDAVGEPGFTDSGDNGDLSVLKENDPIVPVSGVKMRLAINPDQFGRTFEDRTHVFHIKKRPSGFSSIDKIFNLNVRGKRGNIVQAYPAVEYDFVPNFLHIPEISYVHFQWTGADTGNGAGEGLDGTDRSNIVQIASRSVNFPLTEGEIEDLSGSNRLFSDSDVRKAFALAGIENYADCPSEETIKAENNPDQDPKNCFLLNNAPAYFDGGLVYFGPGTWQSTYYYMSTRNNNFSNRSQKGSISIGTAIPGWSIALITVGIAVILVGAAFGGGWFFSKSHPHSKVADYYSKLPFFK